MKVRSVNLGSSNDLWPDVDTDAVPRGLVHEMSGPSREAPNFDAFVRGLDGMRDRPPVLLHSNGGDDVGLSVPGRRFQVALDRTVLPLEG